MEIFLSAGFDIDLIGHKKPKHSLKHWRESFAALGEAGVLEERRGKGSQGRKPTGVLSAEEEFKRAKARIKLLEAEVYFLKKLEALERQKRRHCPPSALKSFTAPSVSISLSA
jgi:transposase